MNSLFMTFKRFSLDWFCLRTHSGEKLNKYKPTEKPSSLIIWPTPYHWPMKSNHFCFLVQLSQLTTLSKLSVKIGNFTQFDWQPLTIHLQLWVHARVFPTRSEWRGSHITQKNNPQFFLVFLKIGLIKMSYKNLPKLQRRSKKTQHQLTQSAFFFFFFFFLGAKFGQKKK